MPSMERRSRVLVELARAQRQRKDPAGALHWMSRAYKASPETVRYTPSARGLVADLAKETRGPLKTDARHLGTPVRCAHGDLPTRGLPQGDAVTARRTAERPLMTIRVSRNSGRTFGPQQAVHGSDDLAPLVSSAWPPPAGATGARLATDVDPGPLSDGEQDRSAGRTPQLWMTRPMRRTHGVTRQAQSGPVPIPPDPAVLYPDIAAHGSLSAALQAVAEGRLTGIPMVSSEAEPLMFTSVESTLRHRNPLQINAWHHERRWSIRGTESFQDLKLVGGTTEDPVQIAAAMRAWHDGEALSDIPRDAPFVHLSGRFEVPDLDPSRLTESEWHHLRTEASELEYPWGPAYQALVEAAHAEPALRNLYPFTSHWALRFSAKTRPGLAVVGPILIAQGVDEYSVSKTITGTGGVQFSTARDAVAAAVRHLPPGLAPVTLGG
ncbi:DUF6193 family natural product biosynthesis protein [Streptomyces sp. NPDC056347]|uniref:DUF6193 family natural product biosynthesis protein n=1 Tax=Streptomyces sp. NPDC056347 TaxID=3345790 RepID=UPI0035E3781E